LSKYCRQANAYSQGSYSGDKWVRVNLPQFNGHF
jgi:hypothetical protein